MKLTIKSLVEHKYLSRKKLENNEFSLPAEVQAVDVALNFLHSDAKVGVAVVGMIVVEMKNGCYFDQLCIVAIVAKSLVAQIEDHDCHLVELQMALVIFGKSSLAVEAVPLVAVVIHVKMGKKKKKWSIFITTGYRYNSMKWFAGKFDLSLNSVDCFIFSSFYSVFNQ